MEKYYEMKELSNIIEDKELNPKEIAKKYCFAVENVKYEKDHKIIEGSYDIYLFQTEEDAFNHLEDSNYYLDCNYGRILYKFDINAKNDYDTNGLLGFYVQFDELNYEEYMKRKEHN